jgi:hypothetical protein
MTIAPTGSVPDPPNMRSVLNATNAHIIPMSRYRWLDEKVNVLVLRCNQNWLPVRYYNDPHASAMK